MRWPWISIVSPSMTEARAVRSLAAACHTQARARAAMMGQRGNGLVPAALYAVARRCLAAWRARRLPSRTILSPPPGGLLRNAPALLGIDGTGTIQTHLL